MKNKRLGDMLMSQGYITEEQLAEALVRQKANGKRLGQELIDDGYITEDQLIDTLRVQLGIDYIDLSKTDIEPSMSKYVPKALAKKEVIVPVRVSRDTLFLAMADPLNFVALEEAHDTSKKKIVPMISTRAAIDHAINVLYGNEGAAEAMAQMRAEAGFTQDEIKTADETEENADAPTIRLVNSIIERAVNEKASDIHVEPTEDEMIIRMRIDGRLHKVLTVPKDLRDAVVSRLKVMGRMNIVEKRVPQDGRAMIRLKDHEIDLRLSTLPTIYGEKVVVRLLGTEGQMLTRKGIGIPESENKKLDKLLANTSGVIMIVGPTGSGKSSTMYALMQELLSESTNLITLEDPVEYHIAGATQVQINEKVGLTFASGLRSILRQDPDIICVGEIRDGETAGIAMRAAMTGHLVITTIHTEDAVSAIDRLKDMGVAPYLISAGLRGIISQRLLRRVCTHCKEEYTPDEGKIELSKIRNYPGRKFYHGRGCDYCYGSGYRGRIGVFEVLTMNDELRHCITSGGDKQEFTRLAEQTDYVPMLRNADDLVEQGITTVEEIIRTISIGD
ncbi:MAG: GspE/PulE family protein [Lachnospiraceae bacterium]|nr:GspE/PulE family protein [Lachnospiraceae bacterium]